MATSPNTDPNVISALAARTQFGQIMQRARRDNTRFVVDRRGEPQVVIMGTRDFLKNIAPEKKARAASRASAREKDADRLSLREINREIHAYRKEPSLYAP
ncbi:MAG TPA: type II toxin-antitoxin system prevent-host-death family antitoxin [Candidatus Sulfotelmatobacter sp.]